MRTKVLIWDMNFHWYRVRHEFWKNGNFTVYCSWCWFQPRLIFGPGKLIQKLQHSLTKLQRSLSTLSVVPSFLWLYVLANRNCHHSSSCWWPSVWRNPSASCSKSWRPTRWTGSTSCPVCPRWWCARLRLSSSSRVGGHCQPGVCPCCRGVSTGAVCTGVLAWKRAAGQDICFSTQTFHVHGNVNARPHACLFSNSVYSPGWWFDNYLHC